MSIALAIWGALKGGLSTIVDKLSLSQIVCIILGCLLLFQTVRIEGLKLWPISYRGLKEQVTNARAATAKCQSDRQADRQAYAQAQAQAQAMNQSQISRAKQQQKDISDAQIATLDGRLELIRSELRKAQSATPQSHPIGSGSGNASAAPCTVTDPAWMCLSPEQRLSAAENEERHDELIDWVIAQSKVDPNK